MNSQRRNIRQLAQGLLLSTAVAALFSDTQAASVTLGTAGDFAVLAGSRVTSTGSTIIDGGDVGVGPGTAIVFPPPGTLAPPYTFHKGDAVALQAQNDLTTAFNTAAGLTPGTDLTGQDLGGLTLLPGVYSFSSSAQLTGILTLDFLGNPDSEFVFQIGSTLTTASASSVLSINGGIDPNDPAGCNVFWQIGSSATLGTTTSFTGHILALADITMTTGATLDGTALAREGAVTLDSNKINNNLCLDAVLASVPETGNTLFLLSLALAPLVVFRRRLFTK